MRWCICNYMEGNPFTMHIYIKSLSVQSLSRVWLFVTPWIAAHQASLSITNSRSSLRLTSIESVMPSSHLILCRSLLLPPPIPPSIRVFSNESTLCMRWYWSFSFSIIPSKEIPGLISFRMHSICYTIILFINFTSIKLQNIQTIKIQWKYIHIIIQDNLWGKFFDCLTTL